MVMLVDLMVVVLYDVNNYLVDCLRITTILNYIIVIMYQYQLIVISSCCCCERSFNSFFNSVDFAAVGESCFCCNDESSLSSNCSRIVCKSETGLVNSLVAVVVDICGTVKS